MPIPPRMKKCHQCNARILHAQLVDGLYCSKACRDQHQKDHDALEQSVRAYGFTQHPDAPNVFLKDGVALTAEEIKHHGITKSLQLHATRATTLALARPHQVAG